jgi:hypothetical protein
MPSEGAGGQRWLHLYPNEEIKHDDILHWTKLNQNWNFMCAECHSTGGEELATGERVPPPLRKSTLAAKRAMAPDLATSLGEDRQRWSPFGNVTQAWAGGATERRDAT